MARSLPTIHHALDLYHCVLGRAPDDALLAVESPNGHVALYARDADGWCVPTPVFELRYGATRTFELAGVPPVVPPPRPKRLVPVAGGRPGRLTFRLGLASFELAYDEHGLQYETVTAGGRQHTRADREAPWRADAACWPPTPAPPLVSRPELTAEGADLETLAAWVLDLDPRPWVPTRLWLPPTSPTSVGQALLAGVVGLRRAAFAFVGEASTVVADGLTSEAVGVGADAETAEHAWAQAVWRHQPWRTPDSVDAIARYGTLLGPAGAFEPTPQPPQTVVPLHPEAPRFTTQIVVEGDGVARPPPLVGIESVPAVRLQVPGPPPPPSLAWRAQGFERAVWTVGRQGHLAAAWWRPDRAGGLLVSAEVDTAGRGPTTLFAPGALLAEVARLSALEPVEDPFATGHGARWAQRTWRAVVAPDGAPGLRLHNVCTSGAIHTAMVEAEALWGGVLSIERRS